MHREYTNNEREAASANSQRKHYAFGKRWTWLQTEAENPQGFLSALLMEELPESIKGEIEMAECAILVQKCVNKIMTKPRKALQAADTIEREKKKWMIYIEGADISRKRNLPKTGAVVLLGNFSKPRIDRRLLRR